MLPIKASLKEPAKNDAHQPYSGDESGQSHHALTHPDRPRPGLILTNIFRPQSERVLRESIESSCHALTMKFFFSSMVWKRP